MKINPDDLQQSIFGSGIERRDGEIHMDTDRELVAQFPYKPELGRYLSASVEVDATQRFMAFCPSCAGKNSHQQSKKLDELIAFLSSGDTQTPLSIPWKPGDTHTLPFDLFIKAGIKGLTEAIKATKLGKWSLLAPSLYETAKFYEERGFGQPDLDPRVYTKLPGWGLKTARLFQMHVFHEPCAVLDTYILKWLAGDKRFHGTDVEPPKHYKDVPTQSISKWETYQRWEDAFLAECVRRNLSPLELDKAIWVHARIKPKQDKTQELWEGKGYA
jgi:hypothetical protein